MADIIIIGGGACGCMAAYEFVKAGKRVALFEARDRPGGRIHSFSLPSFRGMVEGGAEFVHGNLPLTFKLLDEGRIAAHAVKGKNWISKNGQLLQQDDMIENWDVLLQRIKKLPADMALQQFLDQYLPEPQYNELKDSVRSFVEGYDAADINEVSAFSMKAEWSNEDQWEQYRIDNGYAEMISYLEKKCTEGGCIFHLSSPVEQVNWEKGKVQVAVKNQVYEASQLLVTVPIGVLQCEDGKEGAISFYPAIEQKRQAAQMIGYGSVIKILLEFDAPFWKNKKDSKGSSLEKLSFLFSKSVVPTWWTQYPDTSPLFTGWLGGPAAMKLKDATDEEVLDMALRSLAEIFSEDQALLKNRLKNNYIANWGRDPFSRGAYSYATVHSAEAKKELFQAVENTIYFAGEALNTSYESSTVESALASAEKISRKMLRQSK